VGVAASIFLTHIAEILDLRRTHSLLPSVKLEIAPIMFHNHGPLTFGSLVESLLCVLLFGRFGDFGNLCHPTRTSDGVGGSLACLKSLTPVIFLL